MNTIAIIGFVIVLAGVGHFFYSIFAWLKYGVWKIISLGYWFNLERIDTKFIGVNKILNFLFLDISATIPLIALGILLLLSSKENY